MEVDVRRLTLLLLVLSCTVLAGAAAAETERGVRFHGLGPRVGLSIDPNQLVLGMHADLGDPFTHTNLLLPVVEIGVGNNRTTTLIASDLLFRFRDRWGSWTPYVGGEAGFFFENMNQDDDDTRMVMSGILGLEKVVSGTGRFAGEVKFSIIDAPGVKLLAIWAFGH
jgi:hypothetical protein